MPTAREMIRACKPGQEIIYALTHLRLEDVMNQEDQRVFLRAGYPRGYPICIGDDPKSQIKLRGTGEGYLYRRATGQYVGRFQIFQWCFRRGRGRRRSWSKRREGEG